MDLRIRDLERRAINGDLEAAILLYSEQQRQGRQRETSRRYPKAEVEFDHRNFSGALELTVISATEIYVSLTSRERTTGYAGIEYLPVLVNRVFYNIRARFYYYPGEGWLAFDEEVDKTRLYASRSTLRMHRMPGHGDPTLRAQELTLEMLTQIVTQWVSENPELMRQGALLAINNEIIETASQMEKLQEQLRLLSEELGNLVIDELRLS